MYPLLAQIHRLNKLLANLGCVDLLAAPRHCIPLLWFVSLMCLINVICTRDTHSDTYHLLAHSSIFCSARVWTLGPLSRCVLDKG